MPKHPTVDIPNLGPMDHAWDALGDWTVELELPFGGGTVNGVLTIASWTEARLVLEPWGAAAAGMPGTLTFERASRVHLTDAGGGALQWVFVSSEIRWTVQATLWPGSLHLFIQDTDDPDQQLCRATGYRTGEYWERKYPLEDRRTVG